MKAFFVFDVESVGLFGDAFAVAGGVYLANGAAQSEFRFACDLRQCAGPYEDRKWVEANVPVLPVTCASPEVMRTAFWSAWDNAQARFPGIVMAAECAWPVEAGFLISCVKDDPFSRKFKGPYPLHEIASFMAAAGMDPMNTFERRPSELPVHDPLADARQSARLLSEALAKIDPTGNREP